VWKGAGGGRRKGGGMAGNHPGTVTIVVESTSGIVIERNIFSREFQFFESSL
jgi:hypothetical protein